MTSRPVVRQLFPGRLRPWSTRGRAFVGWALAGVLALVAPVSADIILSSEALSKALTAMERELKLVAAGPEPDERARAYLAVGLEGEALAELMSDEVIAHGMQEKALLDLALSRTKDLGVAIAWSEEKRKFLYDGRHFELALEASPKGRWAVDATFKIIERNFFQATASDIAVIERSAARAGEFLRQHPSYERNAEVHMFLAIDYRDLYRHVRDQGDAAGARKYADLTSRTLAQISTQYPETEQAGVAAQLLERFEQELERYR